MSDAPAALRKVVFCGPETGFVLRVGEEIVLDYGHSRGFLVPQPDDSQAYSGPLTDPEKFKLAMVLLGSIPVES